MFLNILVAVDDSESSHRALEHAAQLAEAGNARLTLITVAPPVPVFVAFGGLSSDVLTTEAARWADRVVKSALPTLPPDVVAHTVTPHGHPGPEIVAELRRGTYDLVVLGSRGRGRAREELLGSVNAYVHFHAEIPVLSVP